MWNVESRMWNTSWKGLICLTYRISQTFAHSSAPSLFLNPTSHILHSTSHFLLFPIVIFCSFAQYGHAQTTTERFLWDQANTQITHATTPENFLEAAETYNRLLADDITNPALLNNLGCALTMGGDYKNAQRAFERAERYSGTTLETTEGIAAAIGRRDQSERAELPWYNTAFFWHFRLPAHLRVLTALAGWSMLWTGILFYVLRKRKTYSILNIILPLSETFMITGAMIFLLFGASSLFSILQEKHAEVYWRNVEFFTMDISEMEEQ